MKKGELTSQQIVVLVILIVSFAVILFFILFLNPGELTEKEICHNSVVLAGKTKGLSGGLDCRTNYVCISGGGECENFNEKATIQVDAKNKTQIMNAIAEQMSDCWWMFGEGNVQYVDGNFGSSKVGCALCSVLKFDEKIQKEFSFISYLDLYNYLKNTKKEKGETYLSYLYGVYGLEGEDQPHEVSGLRIDSSTIDTGEKYSVITGINFNAKVLDFEEEDNYFAPFLIKTADTSQTECSEFVTKA